MSEKKRNIPQEDGQDVLVREAAGEDNGVKEAEGAEKGPEEDQPGEKSTSSVKKRKTVKFQLFKDNDKYRGDLFVGVNGVGYLLKRGVPLELPLGVFNAVRNSGEQLQMAQALSDELEDNGDSK